MTLPVGLLTDYDRQYHPPTPFPIPSSNPSTTIIPLPSSHHHTRPLIPFTFLPLYAVVDGRIWVLLSDDIHAVQNFWRVAQSILSQDTYFIGNSVISTPAVFDNIGLSTAFMNVILGGYIGLQHADQVLLTTYCTNLSHILLLQ